MILKRKFNEKRSESNNICEWLSSQFQAKYCIDGEKKNIYRMMLHCEIHTRSIFNNSKQKVVASAWEKKNYIWTYKIGKEYKKIRKNHFSKKNVTKKKLWSDKYYSEKKCNKKKHFFF